MESSASQQGAAQQHCWQQQQAGSWAPSLTRHDIEALHRQISSHLCAALHHQRLACIRLAPCQRLLAAHSEQ